VWILGLKDHGVVPKVTDFRFRVQKLGFMIKDSGFRV
jgi:hypothetical protein